MTIKSSNPPQSPTTHSTLHAPLTYVIRFLGLKGKTMKSARTNPNTLHFYMQQWTAKDYKQYCAKWTVQRQQYSVQCKVCTVWSKVYTLHIAQCTVCSSVYNEKYKDSWNVSKVTPAINRIPSEILQIPQPCPPIHLLTAQCSKTDFPFILNIMVTKCSI